MSLAKVFSTTAVAIAFALTPVLAEETVRDENAEKQAFLETLERDGYAEVGAYKVEKIKDNVYHMDEGIKALPGGATDDAGNMNNPSSIYFVVEDNEILIVDGGNRPDDGSTKEADARIIVEAMTGDRQITYAYSHGHVDHVGLTWNPAVFANIKDQFKVLYMHQADYVDSDKSEKYATNMLFGVVGTEAYKDKLQFIDTGDTFKVGDYTYEILGVPGHTDGSVVYYQMDKEIVFSGDAMGSGFVWLLWDSIENPIGRMVDGVTALKKIVADMTHPSILCGHRWQQFYEGNPQRPNEMTIQYLNDMVAVAQGLQNGSSLIEPYAIREGAVEVSANGCRAKIDTTPEIIQMYLDSLAKMDEAYLYDASSKLSIDSVNAVSGPVFMIYPDEPMSDEEAKQLLADAGLIDILDRSASKAFVMRPVNGTGFTAEDVDRFKAVISSKVVVTQNFNLVGIGKGADFVASNLADYFNFVSGLALINGSKGADVAASIPTYVSGDVTAAEPMIAANKAQLVSEDGTLKRYCNPDSQFEIVVTDSAEYSAAEGIQKAWKEVLNKFGKLGNISDVKGETATWYGRPVLSGNAEADKARKYQYFKTIDSLEGIQREVVTDDLNGSGTLSLWYEYVPDCVKDASEKSVPVIFLMHGNTNDPRTQYDTAEWGYVAVEDGVILVAPEWQGHTYQGYTYEPMTGQRDEETTYLISVLEKVLAKYPQADPSRVYMTGLSAGSRQTIVNTLAMPKYFAAGAGHSGPWGANPADEEKFAATYDMPVVFFTGDGDEYLKASFDVLDETIGAVTTYNSYAVLNELPQVTKDDLLEENVEIYGIPWDEVERIEPTDEILCPMIKGIKTNDKGVSIAMYRICGWGHWNLARDTYMMWDFMKQYARDPEGATIVLEEPALNGWVEKDGKYYWYEDGVKQGTVDDEKCVEAFGTVRGREIYDPASDAWYWLDADADGARAVSKDVWLPYVFQDNLDGNPEGKWVYYDENGHMVKGFRRDGDTFWAYDTETGARIDKAFVNSGNDYSSNYYWYEDGVRQGTVNDPNGVIGDGTVRGREIYDPASDAWYWLDANAQGKPAKNKQVWIPYIFQDEEPGSTEGKWVRYDAQGHMVKGWYRNDEGIYYYDLNTGAMVKGRATIDGRNYYFDETTGIAQGNVDVRVELDTVPTAYVTGGKIVGFEDAKGVKTFLNIPYAATTEGENRFKEPQPVEKWVGERDCTSFGGIGLEALQDPFMCWSKEYVDWGLTFDNGRMGEDLLNLNVWTKAEKGDKKAVIVYIHGGGNTSGSGQNEVYTGQNIVDKDVVYVTINYRYGIQGFLSYKDATGEEISGNFAIMDMVKALEWVQGNIEEFGGDPGNVTIAGQSAGSNNVQKLIICPKAAGLFHHAVAMSANSYEGFGPMRGMDKETAQAQAAEALGNYTVADLRSMSSEEIHNLRNVYNPSSFVIDGEWILDTQAGSYKSGNYNHVDFMTGCVKGDVILFGSFLALPEGADSWTPEAYEQAVRAQTGELADQFLAAYPAEGDIAALVSQISNDMANAQYSIAVAAKNATDGEAKNYQWYFTRVVPDKDPAVKAMWGAFHTGDVGYWLNYFSTTTQRPWEEIDYKIGDLMSSYITNFAKTGNPNGEGLPEWKDVGASEASVKYMVLGEDSKFEEMDAAKAAFWTSYYAQ